MTRKYKQYSDNDVVLAVRDSTSIAQVLVKLGIKQAGGSHYNISKRIKRMDLDTSHFTGQGHMKGKEALSRKSPDDILVMLPRDDLRPRPKTYQLVRALKEIGRPYLCEALCSITPMRYDAIAKQPSGSLVKGKGDTLSPVKVNSYTTVS